MNIVIALDIGESRTGIAKSDPLGVLVTPLKTIPTSTLIEEINALKAEYAIQLIVIGLAHNPQGNDDAQSMALEQGELLKQHFPDIKISYEDESYTSREAEEIINNKGIKIDKNNKELIDMYAASLILEQYWHNQQALSENT